MIIMDAVKNYIKDVVNEILVEKGLVDKEQPAEPVAEPTPDASTEAPVEPQTPVQPAEGAAVA